VPKPALILIAALVAAGALSSAAADLEHISKKIDADGARKIEASVEVGAGDITISSADISEVASVDVDYDPRRIDCTVDYDVRGGTGRLRLESELLRKHNVDTDNNVWDVVLSRRYPMMLEIEAGACDAQIDLGGLSLSELTLEIGAASGEIDFSTPNPVRMEKLSIDAGAASLEFTNLGNANFERCNFDGGAGSFELDFRGKYTDESEISIDIGLGSGEITLPRDVPVRIETGDPGWFSSVEFHNDDLEEVDDGVYESDDYEDADIRILIELDVGLGSVDIYFRD